VIATNWSGPTAFLDEGVGYPLAIDGLESVEDKGAFEGHMWAASSVQHLKQLMSHVVTSRKEAQKKGRSATVTVSTSTGVTITVTILGACFATLRLNLLLCLHSQSTHICMTKVSAKQLCSSLLPVGPCGNMHQAAIGYVRAHGHDETQNKKMPCRAARASMIRRFAPAVVSQQIIAEFQRIEQARAQENDPARL